MARRKKVDWKEVFRIAKKRGYRHDDEGNIYGARGHKLVLSNNPINEYLRFYVCTHVLPPNKKRKKRKPVVRTIPVHRFIAWCKFGDDIFTPGIVVRHMDGNHLNNRPDNLELGTHSDNYYDRLRHQEEAEDEVPF